eukprot:6356789-Amphidinium_carterae.1
MTGCRRRWRIDQLRRLNHPRKTTRGDSCKYLHVKPDNKGSRDRNDFRNKAPPKDKPSSHPAAPVEAVDEIEAQ